MSHLAQICLNQVFGQVSGRDYFLFLFNSTIFKYGMYRVYAVIWKNAWGVLELFKTNSFFLRYFSILILLSDLLAFFGFL